MRVVSGSISKILGGALISTFRRTNVLVSIFVSLAAELVLDLKVRASDFGELRLEIGYAIT
ncbi:MAG: hypothetical protein DMF14_14385 [Verrucomicrobia bacterium]|nr:MAG: hypothetical protein DMF23_00575 [Verrucomicrobiota bacterium]PYL89156.1 MAG: hypothetical protein DMF14_14385 [Verrucomicrobiota bacterium]PYM02116.1 MAG: hypothetical protein DMF19_04165 [Verrucomicrobiota bacterium]